MNVFGKNERSWRKARKRGVSPIIATILLVAITVVLAAVLYVLISGLTTGGVGSKPIGSAFTSGNPILSQCSTSTATALAVATATVTGSACYSGGTAATADYFYTLTIESSSINMGQVLFEVKTSTGATYSGSTHEAFSIINVAGQVVAQYTFTAAGGLAMSTTWNAYTAQSYCNTVSCSTSSPLTTLYTLVVDMGTFTTPTGQGYTLVALGTGGFSGTAQAVTLP